MANPNDRATIQSLRLSISEALEDLEYSTSGSPLDSRAVGNAISILQAAYDNTDPKLLDKDCGCG